VVYIIKEYDENDEHYILMQLATTCCKDKLLFKRLTLNTWFNCIIGEPCPPMWNQQIENAILMKEYLPEKLKYLL